MEREQAGMEQAEIEQRGPAADSWIHTDSSQQQQQLENNFEMSTFVNVGNFLNSQELRLTTDTSSQTPATAAAAASTVTDAGATTSLAPAAPPPAGGSSPSRRIIFGLLAVVVILLGTNAYSHMQNRASEAKVSALRAKVTQLESDRATVQGGSQWQTPRCPGSQLIDTCWLKMGWGDCTNDIMKDPVKPLEDAFRLAWDSTAHVFGTVADTTAQAFGTAADTTAEVLGTVADTVMSDMRQVCDAMHSFGRFFSEL